MNRGLLGRKIRVFLIIVIFVMVILIVIFGLLKKDSAISGDAIKINDNSMKPRGLLGGLGEFDAYYQENIMINSILCNNHDDLKSFDF